MIKANELRIGNYILADTLDGLFMPHFVVGGDILAIQNDELPCETKPIPITPEILEKCGFETDSHDHELELPQDRFLKMVTAKDGYLVMLLGSNEWCGLSIISYLHQLQNLYFALTGQELEINL